MTYQVDQIKFGKYLTTFGPFNSVEEALEEIGTLKVSGWGSKFVVLNMDGSVEEVVDRTEEAPLKMAVCL